MKIMSHALVGSRGGAPQSLILRALKSSLQTIVSSYTLSRENVSPPAVKWNTIMLKLLSYLRKAISHGFEGAERLNNVH